jgi:predicted SprT family Zn-dependent metalloprotease
MDLVIPEKEQAVHKHKYEHFTYACPCGGQFSISLETVYRNRTSEEDRQKSTALCVSCSQEMRVLYEKMDLDFIVEGNSL